MTNKDELSYEASIRYLVEKSNKRAWIVAWIAIFIAVLMGGLIAYMLPLKKVEPYVITVDKTTGMTQIKTAIDKETLKPVEAMDKYFASTYVNKRESYYYDFLSKDYVYVQLLSSPKVAKEYRALYEGDKSRDKVLGDKYEIDGKILSVVLGESAGTKTATIRIELTKKDVKTGSSYRPTIKVVTLSYDYFPKEIETEEERLLNPLGFKVLTYRVDNEVMQ